MPRKRGTGRKGKKTKTTKKTKPTKVKITRGWPSKKELKAQFGLTDQQISRMRHEARREKAEKDRDRAVLWQRYVRALMGIPSEDRAPGGVGDEG